MALDPVARYYDRNTHRFLRLGGSGPAAAIHRAVWGPGVSNRQEAFEFVNRLIADSIALNPASQVRLLDVGCGVGGTATWLAQRFDVAITGVTNSPVQQRIAAEQAQALKLGSRCNFVLADFLRLPVLGPFLAAYAVESFVHAVDPQLFFAQMAAQVVPGGRLFICDDFLNLSLCDMPPNSAAARTVQRFMNGWHIRTLMTPEATREMAAHHGWRIVEQRDLTPYVRSFHPGALRIVYNLTRLPVPSAYWHNLAGGSALQVCIRNGWTGYQMMVFEREEPCTLLP